MTINITKRHGNEEEITRTYLKMREAYKKTDLEIKKQKKFLDVTNFLF
jgi:hypothetical protein